MSAEDALLREYEKIVDLFMNESRIAWELVSIYMAVQGVLLSALVITLSRGVHLLTLGYWWLGLFLGGAVSSFAWFFLFYRSKMWRANWLLKGLRLERQLRNRGLTLNIFELEHCVRTEKSALEYFKGEVRYRSQRWYERIGLGAAHCAMLVLGLIWLSFLLYEIIKFFCTLHL